MAGMRDKRKDRKRKRDHEDHKRYVPYLFLKSEKAKKRLENTEPYFESSSLPFTTYCSTHLSSSTSISTSVRRKSLRTK